MRSEEIRELGDSDIDVQIEELSNQLFELRLRATYEELENPMQIRLLRRDIARLKTIRRERQLAAAADTGEN